jgi:hypothetical protein
MTSPGAYTAAIKIRSNDPALDLKLSPMSDAQVIPVP